MSKCNLFCYVHYKNDMAAESQTPHNRHKKRPTPQTGVGRKTDLLLQQGNAGMLAKGKGFRIPKGALHLADMRFIQ